MLNTTQTPPVPVRHPVEDTGPVPNPMPRLLDGEDLTIEESEHLFERLVLGKLEPAEIAGMLVALRMKGETAEEMMGAALGLFAAAQPFDRPDYLFGIHQHLDGGRFRRRGVRSSHRQARQSQRELALRLGGCPGGSRCATGR